MIKCLDRAEHHIVNNGGRVFQPAIERNDIMNTRQGRSRPFPETKFSGKSSVG